MEFKHNQSSVFTPTANWVGKHACCSLMCHNETGWNPSIIPRQSMHIHNLVKLWNCKVLWIYLNIRPRSSVYINVFLPPNNASIQVRWRSTYWFKTELRKGWFYSFYRTATLKIRPRSPKSNQLFILQQENNIWRLVRIQCSVHEIAYGNHILVEI